MTSNYPDNWNEEAFEKAYDQQQTCEECIKWNRCDCGNHGWCEDILGFTTPDDTCEYGERYGH